MSLTDVKDKLENNLMPKKTKTETVSTSIRVPLDKYEVLDELKRIEGTPINALVLEGIDCLIKSKRKILNEKLGERTDSIRRVLDEL
jgi:hypothetical protein